MLTRTSRKVSLTDAGAVLLAEGRAILGVVAAAERRNLTQLFQMIALGRAVAVMPEVVRAGLGEGLAAVPVVDAPKVTTVVARPPHSRSRAVADLVRVATGFSSPVNG